jgi:hypothetical protein
LDIRQPVSAMPMTIDPHVECSRTTARGVQAVDQDTDGFTKCEAAAMLFWPLLASGQITMRKVDGCRTLAEKPSDQIIGLAA